MKITDYVDYIKGQNQEIADKYKLTWVQENDYILKLQNKTIQIKFFTEYREDNVIGITLQNLEKKEFYTLFDLRETKGFDNKFSYLSTDDKNTFNSLNDTIQKIIFAYSSFMKNYCQDELGGDFSKVGAGTSLL